MIELKDKFYFLLGNFQYSKKNVQSFQSMELLRNQFVPIFPINFKSLIHIEILERIENRILSFKSNKNLIEMLYLLKFDEYFEVCDQKKKMIELKLNSDEFGKLKETEGYLEIKLFGFVNKIEFNYKISTFYSVELKVNENDSFLFFNQSILIQLILQMVLFFLLLKVLFQIQIILNNVLFQF